MCRSVTPPHPCWRYKSAIEIRNKTLVRGSPFTCFLYNQTPIIFSIYNIFFSATDNVCTTVVIEIHCGDVLFISRLLIQGLFSVQEFIQSSPIFSVMVWETTSVLQVCTFWESLNIKVDLTKAFVCHSAECGRISKKKKQHSLWMYEFDWLKKLEKMDDETLMYIIYHKACT